MRVRFDQATDSTWKYPTIVTWIEKSYHRRRRQAALGRLTPIEFEIIYSAADAA